MWWNKSNDASLAVAFVAAYAIRLYVVYSAFGLSENLEQLVYPFSFLLKKKQVSLATVNSWKCDASRCVEMKRIVRTIFHQLLPLEKKKQRKWKRNHRLGKFFFIFSVVFLVWANTSYPRYDVYIVI